MQAEAEAGAAALAEEGAEAEEEAAAEEPPEEAEAEPEAEGASGEQGAGEPAAVAAALGGRRGRREHEEENDLLAELLDDDDDDLIVLVASSVVGTASRKKPRKARKSRKYVERDFERARRCVEEDWVGDSPRFDDEEFRKTFRLSKGVYLQVRQTIGAANQEFRQRRDATGRVGISPDVKILYVLKCLAYGASVQAWHDYFQMAPETARKALIEFCRTVIDVFGEVYLRHPTRRDVENLYEMHAAPRGEDGEGGHGVTGMIAGLDCTHFIWSRCPKAFEGQFQGKEGVPTLVMEAAFDKRLWCWHAKWNYPGTMNDLTILDRSPLLHAFVGNEFPRVPFELGGERFEHGYFTADGIYPKLSWFWKTQPNPTGPQWKLFAKAQESIRKDAERGFGVLKIRWKVLSNPLVYLKREHMDVIQGCVLILHNMMVEDEYEGYTTLNESVTAWDAEYLRLNGEDAEDGVAVGAQHWQGNEQDREDERLQAMADAWTDTYSVAQHFRLRDAMCRHLCEQYGVMS